ncbi:tumor necrosis factor a (TNF superfamily, member 2) [Kryptolebias marmoratus]|uniref:tumor necrosis factor a (TNF superfamily, member 2) n=1 Tax=Kryptolebias marmoratus TaxID=37003 RepID=UPI0007F8C2BB|nr:tumor necrosis factor a (TNF superfamily, member 2) [Kryptolebias marmoratus]
MTGECMIAMNATPDTEAAKQTPQSATGFHSSRLTMALMAFTLCLAVAASAALLVFSLNAKDSRPAEDNFDLRHTLRQISNVRAAIHLEGQYNADMNTSVKWTSNIDQSHSQGGLELDNNEIVIPRDGLYFVYSQASFRVRCSSNADDSSSNSMIHLSHTVKRWTSLFGSDKDDESYQTILHSVRTACQKTAGSDSGSKESWFSVVYMGAVFNLKSGDRLKTEMEEQMLKKVEDEPGKTYFGVFAL